MAPRPPPVLKTLPPAERFRTEIARAVAAGATPATLTLQLTFGDGSRLRRDGSLNADDISFADGEMRYLGVRVVEGGTPASALVIVPD